MESLTSAQAAGLLYAYFWLMMITSAAWMTLVMVGMGIYIERITLGFVSSFLLRRESPRVIIGLIPSVSAGTNEDPGHIQRIQSPTCKLLHGGGQCLLWLAAAVLLVGPSEVLEHTKATASGFIPATLSPWNLGPEVLLAFWAHLKASPRDGLAAFSSAYACLNLCFTLFSLLHRHQESPQSLWARFRAQAVFVPVLFFFPWSIAFVRAIYLAFAT